MISGNIELLPFPIYYDMPRSCLHLATQREGEGEKTIFVFIFTSFSLMYQKIISFIQLHRITFFLCFYTLYLRLNWYGDIARYTLCFCIACWHDLHKRAAMCPTETYSKYFFHLKTKKRFLEKNLVDASYRVIGGSVRVTLALTTIHQLIINGAPYHRAPAFCALRYVAMKGPLVLLMTPEMMKNIWKRAQMLLQVAS